MMKEIKTHYENLQVIEKASSEVIEDAYLYLSQKWHADKNPNQQEKATRIIRMVNEAYAVLSDPVRRREHDAWIKEQRAQQEDRGNSQSESTANEQKETEDLRKREELEKYTEAAEQGDVYIQNKLGLMYQNGYEVPRDATKAIHWYSKAAEQGSAEGQYMLGLVHYTGTGVSKDDRKAAEWWEKAAEQGFLIAQSMLSQVENREEGFDTSPSIPEHKQAKGGEDANKAKTNRSNYIEPEDDHIDVYEIAWAEIENGTYQKGLWIKALVDADGDEKKQKALYIRYRVAQLVAETGEISNLSGGGNNKK